MSKKELAIGSRPSNEAKRWIQRGHTAHTASLKADIFTARLTVDVTPQLRTRIRLAAINAGVPAANLLRALLEREFPEGDNTP